MTKDTERDISLELQCAYVDGELSQADWERVAGRMREDETLRDDVCALRQLKEEVRRAYAATPAVARPAPRARRWAAAAALCAVSAALGWLAHDRFAPPSEEKILTTLSTGSTLRGVVSGRILLHVDTSDPKTVAMALDQAEKALHTAYQNGRSIQIELVANATGLDLLRAGTTHYAARLAAMRARYPTFTLVACDQTLARLRAKGVDVKLLPGTRVATTALAEVLERLREGWIYVRA